MTRSLANKIKAQRKAKQYAAAEKSWEDLESAVLEQSNSVVRILPASLVPLPLLCLCSTPYK